MARVSVFTVDKRIIKYYLISIDFLYCIELEKSVLVAKNFSHSLIKKYGKHIVYIDGVTRYPQACNFLHLKHRMHSPLEDTDRTSKQYFK